MAADKRQPRSLAARVLVIASAWAVIALFVIGILILTLYRNGTERGFRDLLRAQLYNVINSVSLDEAGRLEGTPQLGDLRFSQPGSGWYWIVDIVGDKPPDRLASVSLGDRTVAIASPGAATVAVPVPVPVAIAISGRVAVGLPARASGGLIGLWGIIGTPL